MTKPQVDFEIASRWQLAKLLENLDAFQDLLCDCCTQEEWDQIEPALITLRSPILMALKTKWAEAYRAYSDHCTAIANKNTKKESR